MKHLRSDRGAATLWSLVLTFMLLLSGSVAMATGQIAVARQQASVAMDLAALAGAQSTDQSSDQQCGQAQLIAQANGAVLIGCYLDRGDVVVSGTVPAPGIVQRLFDFLGRPFAGIAASSRAGQPEQ
ncbi:MAG: flp pilus-assembly TadE/G-like family protein [Actinomycetota bacterium]|nr:flp pilus-assembly TadE/G-like family protein [Actinomycetota bacterium]